MASPQGASPALQIRAYRGCAHRPLDETAGYDHASGLRKKVVRTTGDLGGRSAAYTARLVDGVLASTGHTPGELRRAVLARAAQLSGSGSDASSPLSQRERGTRVEDATGASGETIPAALAAYADKVTRHAYRVTDEDLGALRSEEHTSELQSQSNLVCRLLL